MEARHRSWIDRFPAKPVIVAEIGAKYAGMETLKTMVRAAKASGADMVKFQTFRAETVASPNSWFTFDDRRRVPQYDWFSRYELSRDDHAELIALCGELGIGWMSTPSHVTDVDLLEEFDPVAYKTGSDDLTNTPFLKEVARRGRPMVVSTGMSTMAEVEKAVEAIASTGNGDLTLLHCVVSYPARPEDANLRVIETLRSTFGLPVGLSDHTADEFTSVLATQLGVWMIEKHFTLDHALKLPDHEASLTPEEFKRLVDRVRLVPVALGSGVKIILETEKGWRSAARKSIFAARAIRAGQTIASEDLVIRRPADGLHPHLFDEIIGQRACTDIAAGALLSWENLEPGSNG